MSNLAPALRKAAILISALDDRAAEALLDQMGPEMAAKVRSALIALDDIPAPEQQQVLAEFLRQQGSPALAVAGMTGDVELAIDERLAVTPSAAIANGTAAEPPFGFLSDVPAEAIASVLRGEHPQTAAVVIAHLPPEQAAEVLQVLPERQATDALERMAWLHELNPEVQADLARELRRQLEPYRNDSAARQSLEHVTAVLAAMDDRRRQLVVRQLAERNASLARRLGVAETRSVPAADSSHVASFRYRIVSDSTPAAAREMPRRNPAADSPLIAFEDLALLDDEALKTVFAAADVDLVLLALTGADSRLLKRILRRLPHCQAAVLRQRLEHPGPLRLTDIDQAQRQLAAIASRLAREGQIELPPRYRFAAAA